MDENSPESTRLPEETAHRLLARAVELDATRGAELTIAQLRAAATEAGISTNAFESAVKEWRSAEAFVASSHTAPSGSAARIREWLGIQTAGVRSAVMGAPIRNVVALAAFWGILTVLVSFDRAADVHWLVRKATDPLALATGAVIAFRLRARPVGLLLSGLAIAQGAEFVMDAVLGTPAVRGFGSHWALMIAGVAGVLLGGRLLRRPPERDAASAMVTIASPAERRTDQATEYRRALTLRFHGV